MIAQATLLLIALAAPMQFDELPGKSEIRDAAKMFRAETVKEAQATLREAELESGIPTHVETVETLGGETVEETARRRSTALGHQGIYILIAKRESKLDVLLSRRYNFPSIPGAVREAFVNEFKKRDFDAGLKKAASVIASQLDRPATPAKPADDLPKKPTALSEPGASLADPHSLLLKNQYRLTLAGARAILAGAELKAASMDWKMNISVVDDGGHLLCFARMDGGRPASATTSLTKAISAATFRQATGPLPKGVTPPDMLLSLSVQNAAAASGGKITTLLGGLPITVEGQVIGAIGVGGGTGDQDAEVAQAGVDAFLKSLKEVKEPLEVKE